MKPRRLLVDAAVLLDVLAGREADGGAAARLWARVELGAAEGYVAAHGVPVVHAAARQARGPAFARRLLRQLLQVFRVAPLDADALAGAVDLDGPDFDVVLLAAVARASRCHAVVTRAGGSLGEREIAILSPAEALAALR